MVVVDVCSGRLFSFQSVLVFRVMLPVYKLSGYVLSLC
jgi:hypothetical protein